MVHAADLRLVVAASHVGDIVHAQMDLALALAAELGVALKVAVAVGGGGVAMQLCKAMPLVTPSAPLRPKMSGKAFLRRKSPKVDY